MKTTKVVALVLFVLGTTIFTSCLDKAEAKKGGLYIADRSVTELTNVVKDKISQVKSHGQTDGLAVHDSTVYYADGSTLYAITIANKGKSLKIEYSGGGSHTTIQSDGTKDAEISQTKITFTGLADNKSPKDLENIFEKITKEITKRGK